MSTDLTDAGIVASRSFVQVDASSLGVGAEQLVTRLGCEET